MHNVLIAHQSTIPHYRIPFYNTLQRLKPDNWNFDVVFDSTELTKPRFFQEPVDIRDLIFPILDITTYSMVYRGKTFSYQTFLKEATKYDLLIVEHALNNLAYPLSQFHQLFGKKFVYWGHGDDRSIITQSSFHTSKDKIKYILARFANGYFAYTDGVRAILEKHGIPSKKIFVLNNTIDIENQRNKFHELYASRHQIKNRMGLDDKKVLLFVGRFRKDKKIDYLLEVFSKLCELDTTYHLILVGSNGKNFTNSNPSKITYLGPITDLDVLAPIYIASDVYIIPGLVGLGPLQALCYDLPVITMDSHLHKPEFEYLSSLNSIILKSGSTPGDFANAVHKLFEDFGSLSRLRSNTWSSINHLTVQNMANNFISGVNHILEQ